MPRWAGSTTWLSVGLSMAVFQTATTQAQVALEAVVAEGQPVVMPAVAPAAGQPGRPPSGRPGQPGQPQPGQQPKPGEEGKQGGDKKKEDGKDGEDGESKLLTRPDKPTFAPNPEELKVKPDADGRIEFSFNGQAWPDVLHWLAGVSGMSLDWQELPSDHLNLTTRRSYTLDEARDLINGRLLSRGFTLLAQGEALVVVNLKKLDPSLVPRVSPDDLEDYPPHAFAKASFDLPDGLKAEAAKEDVQSLLSPHGKVHALKATNRLLVLDAVANLRDVRSTLYEEEESLASHTVPRPFPLQHARADDVADTLRSLLGIESQAKARKTPQQMQMEMQQAQMRAQMRQQQQKKGVPPPAKKPAVYIVADRRHNILLVNAPPAEMKIIERAIELLDVPALRGKLLAGDMVRVRPYRLVSLDPDAAVRMLEEVGGLDPQTQLTVDAKNRSIIAYATLADHLTIQSVIEKLDGSGRDLSVIWLRRLRADEVAGTIQFLMVGEGKEQEENRYDYWSPWRSRQSDDEPKGEFRVDADVENNRLLLWANEIELGLVRDFLAKLGEIPGESGDPRTVRVMEALSVEQTQRVLGDLQRAWKNVAPNPIIIEATPRRRPPDAESPGEDDEKPATGKAPAANGTDKDDRQTTATGAGSIRFAQLVGDPESGPLRPQPQAAGPPVTVTVTADGRLVFSCPDPAVLDRIEDLYAHLAPAARDYAVFYLKNVKAYWVLLNLEEYFEEELKDDSGGRTRDWYFGGWRNEDGDSSQRRLSKRRKLKFISDVDTNSILVVNATPSQLETVSELIKIYDKTLDEESVSKRRTAVFQVRYSKAQAIADTIKEVFRDLLSSKDKAFQNGKGQNQQQDRTETYVRIYADSYDDKGKKPTPVKAGFGGALALGVDEVSNTIVVSAQEELMDGIGEMIELLDDAARPTTTVQLHHVGPRVDPEALQKVLAEALSRPWPGNQRPEGGGKPTAKPAERPQRRQPPGAQPAPAAASTGG